MSGLRILNILLFIILLGIFFLILGIITSGVFFTETSANEFRVIGTVLIGALVGAIVGVSISLFFSFFLKEETMFKISFISLVGCLVLIILLKLTNMKAF
ncbi:MAG: hypothetical protein JXA68_04440 [Ignavibacteriales bacterium]|nr:hypothetical protein [Ignavibacteriales bacterium]